MILVARRFLAAVSACGLVVGSIIYTESFLGATMDSIFKSAIVLNVGIFVLLLPMYGLEYSGLKKLDFFWKGFAQAMSRWVVPAIKVLGVFFLIHFLLFLVQSHASAA